MPSICAETAAERDNTFRSAWSTAHPARPHPTVQPRPDAALARRSSPAEHPDHRSRTVHPSHHPSSSIGPPVAQQSERFVRPGPRRGHRSGAVTRRPAPPSQASVPRDARRGSPSRPCSRRGASSRDAKTALSHTSRRSTSRPTARRRGPDGFVSAIPAAPRAHAHSPSVASTAKRSRRPTSAHRALSAGSRGGAG